MNPKYSLFVGLLAGAAPAAEFAGDVFALDHSVLNSGSASAFPSSQYAPSRFLQYPADASEAPAFAVEGATLPLFGGLSQAVSGAGTLRLESNLRLSAFTSIVSTPDIPVRPMLSGTAEERLANPALRPGDCGGCPSLRDRVYLGSLNALREFSGLFPRTGLESRPIPFVLSVGVTAKYFWEELEGGDYLAQNLNLDAGMGLRVLWGYNPVEKTSTQVFKIHIGGFELMPTRQESDIGGRAAYETLQRRWHLSAAFEQGVPDWNSKFALGFEQRSERGSGVPALGGEWRFAEALALRGGWDGDFLAAGFSVRYRWIALHYALRTHELGTSLYQVAVQVQRD